MTPDWAKAMERFYADLDAELAETATACRGCGECCHFDVADHVLYASELERRYLALKGGPLPPAPDGSAEQIAAGLRCPYQVDARCLAREGRVLGCRLHFCGWDDSEAEGETAARRHEELKRIHDRLGVEWGYGRLFPLSEMG